jgi:hypothetical protein
MISLILQLVFDIQYTPPVFGVLNIFSKLKDNNMYIYTRYIRYTIRESKERKLKEREVKLMN